MPQATVQETIPVRRIRPRFLAFRALATAFAALAFGVIPRPDAALAQGTDGPAVLIVTAHPDDEAMFAGSIYKITHDLGGEVDLALVTDGSGGFRYAYLAEPIYGLELTDEAVARHHLPAIRKRELMAAGELIGIRNYFFLDAFDHAYTENVDSVLSEVWDAEALEARLAEIMRRGGYDFAFVHLPVPNFHAHHVAASILALEAAATLAEAERPAVLGSFIGSVEGQSMFPLTDYEGLDGYPITRVHSDLEPFVFDRRQPIGPDERLNYQIVVNWLIAEHKSQGTMQLLMNAGDIERFWYFLVNSPDKLAETRALFERLARPRADTP